MAETRVERRLAAILAADVVGYSRLMGLDEEGTLSTLKAHRHDLIDPKISEHHGRIVKTTGDGVLVAFPSAIEALRCAIEVQHAIAELNATVPNDRRVEFRIGINVGDVIFDEGDIFGDGVNIAARLEALAAPGGICLADDAYRQIKGRLAFDTSDMGEYQLKNIAQPVRVHGVRLDGDSATRVPGLSDRPSIAVLPFDNMSGDPEQAYFSEGITEDIITELSRFPDLFVIARNSTFAYKGKCMKVQEIARELGVHYVLEGSVRKAANRVRVTAQFIDAATGTHLWANRFDREISDIFDIQDEIARTVAATVSGRASAAFAQRVFKKPPENMAAWEYVLAAKVLHHRGERDDNAEAQRLIDRALVADPNFPVAHAWKCCILGQAWERGFGEYSQLFPIAIAALEKAISLDPNDLEANRVMCEAYMEQKKLDDARRHNDRAYSANPNDPRILAQRGELLTWLGHSEEAAEWVRTSMQLDPFEVHTRAHLLGRALLIQGRYRDAAEAYAANPRPRWSRRAEHAAALALAGEIAAAREQIAEVLRVNPGFSADSYLDSLPFARDEDRERMRQGLKKAMMQ